MVPWDFSRVGSTQANGILASIEVVECEGNVLDPVVVNESAPTSWDFESSQYVNENAGTVNILKHHKVELIKFGVKFGRGAFTMYNLHVHKNPYHIVHDGQNYHGGLDGGIAPHSLSIASAANQLRVAYEHKQLVLRSRGVMSIVVIQHRYFSQACMFAGLYNIGSTAYCLIFLVAQSYCMHVQG